MSMWKAPTNSVFEPRSYDNRESLARKFAAWQNCLRSNGEGEDDEDISATETQRPSSYDVPASERAAAYGLYGETTLEGDPPGPGSRFDKSHRSSGRLYSEHSGLNGARFAGEKLLPLHPAWDERGVSTHVGHSRTAPSAVDTETLPFRKSGIAEIPTHLPLDSSASAKNKTPSHAIDSDYEQRLSQGHAGERSVRTSWTRTLAPRVPESFEQLLNSQFENALSKFSSLVPLEPRGFPLRGSSSPVETERAAYRTLDGSSDGMSLIAGECTARRWDYEMPSAGDTVSALLEFGIVQALPRVTALERHLTEEESLNSNSPAVLRRDIDDLRAQVEELRVASEGLVASLSRAEGEISALRRELQRRDLRADEVARENRALREQADRLQGGRQAGTQPGPHELALLQRFASQGTEVHTNPDFSAWDGALLPPEPRSALACASPASAASSELTDELLRGFEVTEGGAEAGPRRADAASFAVVNPQLWWTRALTSNAVQTAAPGRSTWCPCRCRPSDFPGQRSQGCSPLPRAGPAPPTTSRRPRRQRRPGDARPEASRSARWPVRPPADSTPLCRPAGSRAMRAAAAAPSPHARRATCAWVTGSSSRARAVGWRTAPSSTWAACPGARAPTWASRSRGRPSRTATTGSTTGADISAAKSTEAYSSHAAG
uniref:Uncharacterized protein LOC116953395 isoform X1 n=1 Tax=Petromyzon marinus TaxID=7757 RepID=A0AAJ7U419_PETMA|nr:uncharacterized protein LOC116953395 isoform X1 [Petromyzon marinus]